VSRAPIAPRGLVGLIGLATLAASAGCPGGDSNPEVLWLALDGDERHVKLTEVEPAPF
jgi:hypothetical protein